MSRFGRVLRSPRNLLFLLHILGFAGPVSTPAFAQEIISTREGVRSNKLVPTLPAMVRVVGTQLLVRERLPNGTLASEKPYFIRGVCWSPASISTLNDRTNRRQAFRDWAPKDLPLLKQMNANTVYTFLDFGIDIDGRRVLDQFYRWGIMVIPTVDLDGTNDLERITQVVTRYKDHPAILFWAIGNEWNINLYHKKFGSLLDAARATEDAARQVKRLDKSHPVAAIFGEIIIPDTSPSTADIVTKIARSVDIWGLNIYRGATFGKLFSEWQAITSKPMFLSEFGTDSYFSTKWWPVKGGERRAPQAEYLQKLWGEIRRERSASDPTKACIGGTVFEWTDEWWKTLPEHGGKISRQDNGGFPTPWNKDAHPDGFANEEYFGVMTIRRAPKPAYRTLQTEFGKDAKQGF